MELLFKKIQKCLDDIEYAQFCLEEQDSWEEAKRIERALENITDYLEQLEKQIKGEE